MWIDFGDVFCLLCLLFTDFLLSVYLIRVLLLVVSFTDFGVWGEGEKYHKVFAFRLQKYFIDLLAI